MPLYDYDCQDCGERFEALVRGTSDEPVCPKCGGRKLERAWSVFSGRSGSSTEPTRPCGIPASAPT